MPKAKPLFTHEVMVITDAEFLALSGGSLQKGSSFSLGDADALCMKITDDDKFLNSSHHHDDDDDDNNQTGEIDGQGSVGDVEIGAFVRMKSSTGKKYDLIEIKTDAGSFWTFAGNIPGSDETLTVQHVFSNHKKAKYDKGLGVKLVAAVDDTLTTDEDTSVEGNVLANDCAPSHSHDDDDDDDVGIEHSDFRVVAVEGGTVGTAFLVESERGNEALVRVSANGRVIVDPTGGFDSLAVGETDTVTFEYTLGAYHTVGKGKKATQVLETDKGTVTVTVTGVNDAPVAVADTPTTSEDNAVTISVLANDSDVDGDTLTVTGAGTAANGTVVVNANGTITYTPNANFNGTDSFTYTTGDGNGGTATGTVTVTVNAVNDAPVAVADAPSTDEDNAVTIAVLANDTDVDGDTLTVTGVGTAANGTAVVNANSTVTYTPNANFNGTDSFTYTVSDGNGGTATGTVTVTVNAVNDRPVVGTDTPSTDEDNAVTIAVLANDSDVDGDTLTVTGVGAAANGSAVVNANGTITYTPNANFNGTDSFRYTVSDGNGGTTTGGVRVTVNAVNDAPVAVDDSYQTPSGAAPLVVVAADGVLDNDSDVDGDGLTATLLTGPTNGRLQLNADGSFTYAPSPLFQGDATFTYQVADRSGATATGTATVTVGPAGPTESESYDATEDTTLVVGAGQGVLANDPNVAGQLLTASLLSGPANGRLQLNADGSFTYLPAENFNGEDGFSYRVTDSAGVFVDAEASIDVGAVNDAPEMTLLSRIGVAGQFSAGLVAARMLAEDVDGDDLTFSLTGTDAFLFRVVEIDDADPDTHLLHLVARDRDDDGNLLFPNGDRSVRELAGADLKFDVTVTASDGTLEDDLAIFFGAISAG